MRCSTEVPHDGMAMARVTQRERDKEDLREIIGIDLGRFVG